MAITLVERPATFDLEIPEAVEAKIRHLCSQVHEVEWSGTLFYKVEGSLDTDNFKVTCLDICVMDIGNSVFTDFDDTEDIISYRVDHPELLQPGVYEGLIHSHNRMATFFSGTDIATLRQEGETLNHFLSLIVNNEGTYTAKITRKLVRKVKAEAVITYTETSSYRTFENVEVELAKDKVSTANKSEEKEDMVIEVFTAKINKETSPERFAEVDARLRTIKQKKSARMGGYQRTVIQTPANTPKPAPKSNKEAFSTTIATPKKNYTGGERYVQGQLFPEEEEVGVREEQPLCLMESYDEELIKELCIQLLTGSILVEADKIDPEKWVNKMDNLYVQRFGALTDSDNKERLANWIEAMVSHLIYTPDENLEERVFQEYGTDYKENDFAEVCAYDMAKFLLDLPDSEVKNIMIEELENWLPDDVSIYF